MGSDRESSTASEQAPATNTSSISNQPSTLRPEVEITALASSAAFFGLGVVVDIVKLSLSLGCEMLRCTQHDNALLVSPYCLIFGDMSREITGSSIARDAWRSAAKAFGSMLSSSVVRKRSM